MARIPGAISSMVWETSEQRALRVQYALAPYSADPSVPRPLSTGEHSVHDGVCTGVNHSIAMLYERTVYVCS